MIFFNTSLTALYKIHLTPNNTRHTYFVENTYLNGPSRESLSGRAQQGKARRVGPPGKDQRAGLPGKAQPAKQPGKAYWAGLQGKAKRVLSLIC